MPEYLVLTSTFEPEVQVIIAVYMWAWMDLSSKNCHHREQARLFFEADGWDVSKIKVRDGRKTTSRAA